MKISELVKSKRSLIIFLCFCSFAYWIVSWWWDNVLKLYDPLVMITILYVLLGISLIITLVSKYTTSDFLVNLKKIPVIEYGKILAIVAGICLLGYLYLKEMFIYHDVATIRITDFVSSMIINILVIYLFYNKKFTMILGSGMMMIGIGGYLVIK